MSAYADITLTDDSAVTATVSTVSVKDEKSIRRDLSLPMATPLSLTKSHQKVGSGNTVTDRHLVRLDKVKQDVEVDDVSVLSASAYFVIELPRRIFTEAEIASMVQMVANHVVANVSAIIKGEL